MNKSIMHWSWSLVAVAGVGLSAPAEERPATATTVELHNVSHDATREVWQDLNRHFVARYQKQAGVQVSIRQSHGASENQSAAVLRGQPADVATLALWSDVDALRRKGLVAPGWERRLPNRSRPYTSTIVFVVRKGNPRDVRDWPDLVKDGVQVVTPDPRTSGNGQLSFLAAWGSVLRRGGSEEEARTLVTKLYRQVPVLEQSSRQAADAFAVRGIGDVHLAWENEARREVHDSGDALQIVYPPVSIQAEPPVAVVDAEVDRRGTRAVAEAYLKFLYTDEAQDVIARHFLRPIRPAVLRKHAADFPEIELFTVEEVSRDWDDARQRFFANGGVFDRIANPQPK